MIVKICGRILYVNYIISLKYIIYILLLLLLSNKMQRGQRQINHNIGGPNSFNQNDNRDSGFGRNPPNIQNNELKQMP
jgi:hypothetical protein